MVDRLFVYGTLGPGRPNAHILEAVDGVWEEAYVHGHLIEAGWGAKAGYPALRLHAGGQRVDGFLFTSENLAMIWAKLDAFEGADYSRVQTPVFLTCGGSVEAHLYALKEEN